MSGPDIRRMYVLVCRRMRGRPLILLGSFLALVTVGYTCIHGGLPLVRKTTPEKTRLDPYWFPQDEDVLHQSCSVRYVALWDTALPRAADEFQVSQCMMPSPAPEYIPRDKEWGEDEPWRLQELQELGRTVQLELETHQNPPHCKNVRIVLCTFDQFCGIGCKLHHVIHCLSLAYATRRVVVMENSGHPYQNDSWYGTLLLPLSNTCHLSQFKDFKVFEWTEATALGPHPVVRVPIASNTKWQPALYPVAVPRHLAKRLFRLHCAPHAWWMGQLLTFVSRPGPKLKAKLDQLRHKIGFKRPVVGVQIRHGRDKWPEAPPLPLRKFTRQLEKVVAKMNFGNPPRVYLATDDPKVVLDAKAKLICRAFLAKKNANNRTKTSLVDTARKGLKVLDIIFDYETDLFVIYGVPKRFVLCFSFTQYQWILHETGVNLAEPPMRWTPESLEAALLDMYLLGDTDYVICTMTSNMCRMGYELLQTRFADGSWRATSLDQPFFIFGQRDFIRTASEDHTGQGPREISMKKGDPIGGFLPEDRIHCKGRNERSGQDGLYVASKVLLQNPVEDFPTLRLKDNGGH